MTTTKRTDSKLIDRRQFLKLTIASVLVIAGCPNVRQTSDLDAAMADLNRRLDEIADNDEQAKLFSIAQRIQIRARELANEHRAFSDNFDGLLRRYDTTEAELEQLIDTYDRRRNLLRNDLLHLQDELHTSISPDDWAEVVRALNRAGQSLARYTLSEG